MTKKHFIALADALKASKPFAHGGEGHTLEKWEQGRAHQWEHDVITLAGFCREQNPNFNTNRWLDYINGKCGSNGGKVKAAPKGLEWDEPEYHRLVEETK